MALPAVLLGAKALLGKAASSSLAKSAVAKGTKLLGAPKKRGIARSVASKLASSARRDRRLQNAQRADVGGRTVGGPAAQSFAQSSTATQVLTGAGVRSQISS